MKLEYLSYISVHVKCYIVELRFPVFSEEEKIASNLQQPINKCALGVYSMLSVWGWGSIRKLWLIHDITMMIRHLDNLLI